MTDNEIFSNRTALYHTFGCKLNFAETSTVARLFAERGVRRVSSGESPDFIVINSCSVTELADKKCRQTIRSLHRKYPESAIIVTGCYAQLKNDEVAALPGVKIVAGIDRKLDLCNFVEQWLADNQPKNIVGDSRDIRSFMPSCSRGDRTRYFLKVQDGCDYWCTYCTIPKARGRSRSGSIEQIAAQAEAAAAEGAKEIVITGVNIGDFGKGRDDNFLDLITRLDLVEGIERYRISSIEPNLLTDDIIDFVAHSKRFMPHFHIPLQSGSDEVLRLMRRHYDTAMFAEKINRVRSAMPDAFIGVDLIVGARGESDLEFERSKAFVESLDISRLHVFTYSERPGTRALDIDIVVPQEVKHQRTRQMLAISEDKLNKFVSRFEGAVRPVLLEHPKAGHPLSGFTDNYLKVEIAGIDSTEASKLDNKIRLARIGRSTNNGESVEATIVS